MNWKIKKTFGNVAIVGESGGMVAKSIQADPLCYQDSDVKNAQLMASAPELLEALEGLFKECAMIHKYGGSACNQKQSDLAIKKALEAIDRAHNVS